MFTASKYPSAPVIALNDRQWPNNTLSQAPQWCSVDLRDGNQALINPMNAEQKHRLFDLLIAMGFKQIEVGFPAASQTDYDFVREIIEQDKIPDDVSIQVLTQARDSLIERTFSALEGAKKAIVHVYNSTSTIQREKVFKLDQQGIMDITIQGAQKVKSEAAKYPQTQWQFQYSPESFTQTEVDYAVEVCNAVIHQWQGMAQPIIINLPATVEVNTPNVFADQVEYFCRHVAQREQLIISLHTHNDRGTAVAAAELGLLAGADRIEGTLLGNGERTGNMDIITIAMNLYSQGIAPELDMQQMDKIIDTVEHCTDIAIHPRHPYAGDLVFTAFSGSHQDAIKKCLDQQNDDEPWKVAYLPIDPADIGRSYEAVIRINSQSGKGGVAYMVQEHLGINMPRWMQMEFSRIVQQQAENTEQEVNSAELIQHFQSAYANNETISLNDYQIKHQGEQQSFNANISINGNIKNITAIGQGVLEACCNALQQELGQALSIIEFSEQSVGNNSQAEAQAFIQINIGQKRFGGFAQSQDTLESSLKALFSALNHGLGQHSLTQQAAS